MDFLQFSRQSHLVVPALEGARDHAQLQGSNDVATILSNGIESLKRIVAIIDTPAIEREAANDLAQILFDHVQMERLTFFACRAFHPA